MNIINAYVRKQIISEGESREGRPGIIAFRVAHDVKERLEQHVKDGRFKSMSELVSAVMTEYAASLE